MTKPHGFIRQLQARGWSTDMNRWSGGEGQTVEGGLSKILLGQQSYCLLDGPSLFTSLCDYSFRFSRWYPLC